MGKASVILQAEKQGRHRFREGRSREARQRSGRNEAWYRALVEQVPAVVYVDASDEARSAVYMSPRVEGMLGYAPEEWLEDPELWVKLLHPDDRERALAEAARTRETGVAFRVEYRLMARDGRVVWVRDEAVPVKDEGGRPTWWQGVLLDITERKLAEEELRCSEERFRSLVQNNSDIITVVDAEGTIRYVSPAVERVLGYAPEEMVGQSAFDYVHPDDLEEALGIFAEVSSGPGIRPLFELRLPHKDGSWRYLETVVTNMFEDPSVGEIVVNQRDVTERKRAEEALRESEERFRVAFDAAAVGMAHVGPDGKWLSVNDKLCQIVGYSRDELLGSTSRDISRPEGLDADLEQARRMLEGKIGSYSMEKRYFRKDGSVVWVDLTVSLVREPSGEPNCFIAVVDEISERKLAEFVADPVTPRELEVLRLVASGWTNPEIARSLAYSVGTIKLHIQGIIAKLGVANRAEAAARAVEIGLLPPPR